MGTGTRVGTALYKAAARLFPCTPPLCLLHACQLSHSSLSEPIETVTIMWTSAVLSFFAVSALAQYTTAPPAQNGTIGPDANGKYEISAEGIRANFIPYGASISNLFINDTHGVERDIVLGFDNASYYSIDPIHPHLGGVPGAFGLDPIATG